MIAGVVDCFLTENPVGDCKRFATSIFWGDGIRVSHGCSFQFLGGVTSSWCTHRDEMGTSRPSTSRSLTLCKVFGGCLRCAGSFGKNILGGWRLAPFEFEGGTTTRHPWSFNRWKIWATLDKCDKGDFWRCGKGQIQAKSSCLRFCRTMRGRGCAMVDGECATFPVQQQHNKEGLLIGYRFTSMLRLVKHQI